MHVVPTAKLALHLLACLSNEHPLKIAVESEAEFPGDHTQQK